MMYAVLRSPKRLPARYNRRVQIGTRDLVRRRHGRQRQYAVQRWARLIRRIRERWAKGVIIAFRYSPWIIAGIVIIAAGVVLFSPLFDVREIRVVRSDRRIDVESVQHALMPIFGEHLLFVNEKNMLPLLEQSLPDVRTITIEKRYPSTLALRLVLEPIVAMLEIVDPTGVISPAATGTGGDALGDYLTADGMYVTYPPALLQGGSGTAAVRIVDWGVRPEPWKHLLDQNVLEHIAQAEQALRTQFGDVITQRVAYLRSREFHLQTKKHALWFDMRSPITDQIDRYSLFLQSADAGNASKYVDLRLHDRIIYR